MSLTTKVLIGLAAGLCVGIAISASGSESLARVPGWIEPIGTIWVNALRMTVIPLVMSAIIIGINSLPDTRDIGRIGGRALALMVVLLFIAATFSVLVGPIVMSGLTIDPAAAEAMRASAQQASGQAVENAQKIAGFKQWLIDLVPVNPVKAAADGAMLPLIIFSVLLGLAITRIGERERDALVGFVRGLLEGSLRLVRWILVAAPVGVFALSVPLATRLGVAAAGAVLYYILAVAVMCTAFIGAMYVAAWLIGGKSPRLFAKACAPAQAVAASARSSLVTLPAMLDGADKVLGLPLAVRSFFLPLSAAVFKCGSAIMLPIGVLFMAKLYGIDVSVSQLATVVLMSVVTTFSVPAIPGGTIIVMVPVLLAAGLPVEAVGILLGVDTIPDMFRTVTHVTTDMASATILSRFEPVEVLQADPSLRSG